MRRRNLPSKGPTEMLGALGSPEGVVSRSRPPPPPTTSQHPLLECDTAGNAATPCLNSMKKSQKNKNRDIVGLPGLLPPLPLPLFSLLPPPRPSPTRTASANLSLRVLLFFSLLPVPCLVGFLFLGPPPNDVVFVTLKGLSKCSCCRARLASPPSPRTRLVAIQTPLRAPPPAQSPSPLRLSSTPV